MNVIEMEKETHLKPTVKMKILENYDYQAGKLTMYESIEAYNDGDRWMGNTLNRIYGKPLDKMDYDDMDLINSNLLLFEAFPNAGSVGKFVNMQIESKKLKDLYQSIINIDSDIELKYNHTIELDDKTKIEYIRYPGDVLNKIIKSTNNADGDLSEIFIYSGLYEGSENPCSLISYTREENGITTTGKFIYNNTEDYYRGYDDGMYFENDHAMLNRIYFKHNSINYPVLYVSNANTKEKISFVRRNVCGVDKWDIESISKETRRDKDSVHRAALINSLIMLKYSGEEYVVNKNIEIEKKYMIQPSVYEEVVLNLPKNQIIKVENIQQSYINLKPEVRLRSIDNEIFELTMKEKDGNNGGRIENTIEISKKKYHELIKGVGGKLLNKDRYYIQMYHSNDKPYIIHLDVYKESNTVTAEVEFDSYEEFNDFKSPEWFDEELIESGINKILAVTNSNHTLKGPFTYSK